MQGLAENLFCSISTDAVHFRMHAEIVGIGLFFFADLRVLCTSALHVIIYMRGG